MPDRTFRFDLTPHESALALAAMVATVAALKMAGSTLSLFVAGAVLAGGLASLGLTRVDGRPRDALILGSSAGAVVLFGWSLLGLVAAVFRSPPEWDFQVLWLNAQVVARGLDFYRAESYQQVADALNLTFSPDFTREILGVGFWYPPPTMFLFAPLASLSLNAAQLAWSSAHGIILVTATMAMWHLLSPRRDLTGLAVISALVLLFSPVHSTFAHGQTNALLLLCILVFWRSGNAPVAGLWLGCAVIVKPVAFALLLIPLLRRQYRTLVWFAVTGAVSLALSVLAFGWETTVNFFVATPTQRVPGSVYTEPVAQSMLAVILRATGVDLSTTTGPPPLPFPFLIAAFVTGLLTLVVLYRIRGTALDTAVALTLAFALLIYPATLAHYTVLLLPLLLVLARPGALPGGRVAAGILVTVVYVLVSRGGAGPFTAILLCWSALIVSAWWIEAGNRGTPLTA